MACRPGGDCFVCQASEEKINGLEMIVEAERSAHLETRFTCQLLQVTSSDDPSLPRETAH